MYNMHLRMYVCVYVHLCVVQSLYTVHAYVHTQLVCVVVSEVYFIHTYIQSNLVSEYTWGPSKLLLTISSTC